MYPQNLEIQTNRVTEYQTEYKYSWEKYISLPDEPGNMIANITLWTFSFALVSSVSLVLPVVFQITILVVLSLLGIGFTYAFENRPEMRTVIILRVVLTALGLLLGVLL